MSMGVDYGLVEEIVGHSSRLMVEHYRHAGLRERLTAMETMNAALDLKQLEPAGRQSWNAEEPLLSDG